LDGDEHGGLTLRSGIIISVVMVETRGVSIRLRCHWHSLLDTERCAWRILDRVRLRALYA